MTRTLLKPMPRPILCRGPAPLLLLAVGLAPACTPAGAADQQPLVRTTGWRHLFEPGPGDPGVGVVTFAAESSPAPDTIPLFRQPGDRRPAGYVLRVTDTAALAQTYTVEWPESLGTNLLEFDYEIAGLPADSSPRPDGWVQVIPGFRADSTPIRAWTLLMEPRTGFLLWSASLLEHGLYFREEVPPQFFQAPDGPSAAFPLPDAHDYILHPLEARGGWLRVRAVTPSDYCAEPEAPAAADLWIRYLDRGGRPLVWYHTRGCSAPSRRRPRPGNPGPPDRRGPPSRPAAATANAEAPRQRSRPRSPRHRRCRRSLAAPLGPVAPTTRLLPSRRSPGTPADGWESPTSPAPWSRPSGA